MIILVSTHSFSRVAILEFARVVDRWMDSKKYYQGKPLEQRGIVNPHPEIAGAHDINTTLRYLHTTNKDILNVISPLDRLELKI